MDGLNGFLASRPADLIEFVPEKQPYDWELDMEFFGSPLSHMAA